MNVTPKIKIHFVLPSLVAGGAERVMSFIAQHIDKEKFEPLLLIIGHPKDTVYDISNVNIIYLKKSRVLFSIPHIFGNFLFNKPDIVISSISHTNAAMAIISPFFSRTKFVGREATILSKRKNEKKTNKIFQSFFVDNAFRNLDVVLCQSKDMADDMITNFQVPKHKIRIINNPISSHPPIKSKSISNVKKFITIGRLTEVKGHLRLLEILAKLKVPFIYTIIGEGDQKEVILKKAENLNLLSYIQYIPFTNNINDQLAEHHMFLQGSFVEGFPNVLLESCMAGTPVVAFDVPGGTKEIVIDGINGFLVSDEIEFLEKLYDNRTWDPKMVRESVYKKFNSEKIIKEYEDLFMNIIKK